MSVEPRIEVKIGTFFLDNPKDVKTLEALFNDPNVSVLKRELIKIREKNVEFSEEGRPISERTVDRPQIILDYEKQDI